MCCVCSLAIGVCNLLFAKDPIHDAPNRKAPAAVGAIGLLQQIWDICRIPTFALIIVQVRLTVIDMPYIRLRELVGPSNMPCGMLLQGIVGSVPWTALVFLTLYLQLLGMSDFAASMLMAVFLGSTALGGLLGGYVGDMAAAKSPHHGRIFATQFSVFIGIPFSLLIFKVGFSSSCPWPPHLQ